jgi:hypothetical protein
MAIIGALVAVGVIVVAYRGKLPARVRRHAVVPASDRLP